MEDETKKDCFGVSTSKLSIVKTTPALHETETCRLGTKAKKGNEKNAKKKTGLKLATDRVKSIGSLTPCSSPSDGPMFSSAKGPDWKKIEIEVTQALQVKKDAD